MSTPDPSTPVGVPVCYRHPDRETYIRCNRCERPICPDCMTSAAVGFQCPECVAEGRASVREARTVLGAKTISRPYVTLALIGLNIVFFAVQQLAGDSFTQRFDASYVDIAAGNEYFRLLSATFLHASLFHIGMNMLALWLLGPHLESLLGHVRFTVLYLVAGIGGSVASFWFTTPYVIQGGSYFPASGVGASGAVFGLFGAYLVIGRRMGADLRSAWILIGVNLVYGFIVPGIDWRAHVGGAVTGAVLAAVFVYLPGRHKVALQVVSVVAIVVALAGLVVWRDQVLTAQMIRDQLLVAGLLGG